MDEVTAIQAAALTGLSERTIRRRIATGELPARRIAPNRYAINVDDLARHDAHGNSAARLDTLEQRVAALESQQRLILRALDSSTQRAPAPEMEAAEDDAERLDDLILQLASAIERLSPHYLQPNGLRQVPRTGQRAR